jgi:hypothetical protein
MTLVLLRCEMTVRTDAFRTISIPFFMGSGMAANMLVHLLGTLVDKSTLGPENVVGGCTMTESPLNSAYPATGEVGSFSSGESSVVHSSSKPGSAMTDAAWSRLVSWPRLVDLLLAFNKIRMRRRWWEVWRVSMSL